MPKLINVAGKIKDTRKRLGLTQKDFILAVSKKLHLSTPLNDSLAMSTNEERDGIICV